MKPSSPGLLSYRRWSQFLEIIFISQIYSKVVYPSTRSDQNNPIPGFGRSKAGTRRNYGREEIYFLYQNTTNMYIIKKIL